MSGVSQPGSVDSDPQMQADIDRMAVEGEAATAATAALSMPVPPGMEPLQFPQDPNAMMHFMMRMMMNAMRASFQQATLGTSNAGAPPAALSPHGGSHWRQDTHMANVRLDERAFRRLEKFTNKEDERKE